ncbi:secreted phage protein [Streptococcus dysgalactiae subsp. dysgalactiae]|uniref:Secreted phage protein n=1 Tax=Streptococcus dysgalactiae subsp. dysgalactiae TaxID=99822 RepID=A0A380JXR2_STRDY|nr:hypothetical protein [Streptococcus dysgalactiae]SUN51222.1 secreted phage protein [Streptococcus dysgalactiae subsp. dysgalactiae]
MKNKLMLAATLLTVGVATNVKAEVYGNQRIWGFRTDWQQGRDFGAKPIHKGDNEIKVKTAPEAVLTVYEWKNNKWELIKDEVRNGGTYSHETYREEGGSNDQIPRRVLSGGDGLITFPLKKNVQLGDKYKLILTVGGFYLAGGEWTVGESIPKDEEERDEAEIQKFIDGLEQKERESEEQKYAEELFKQQQQEAAKKTWHQRLSDSIQDQWWNFKDWWKG